MEATAKEPHTSAIRRSAIRRSIGLRIVAAIVVIAFVCFVGDVRRKRIAVDQMDRYAAALNATIGESGVIPLNLSPQQLLDTDHVPIDMTTLTRTQVACLRDRDQAFMCAWTVRLIQVLGLNGRAIVTYQNGHAAQEWITESAFASRYAAQTDDLRSCK